MNFTGLGALLRRDVAIGTLATAIEKCGIDGWDRYWPAPELTTSISMARLWGLMQPQPHRPLRTPGKCPPRRADGLGVVPLSLDGGALSAKPARARGRSRPTTRALARRRRLK